VPADRGQHRACEAGAVPAPWPATEPELVAAQEALASRRPDPFRPQDPGGLAVGGCFVCFPRGVRGAVARGGEVLALAGASAQAGAPYVPGLLALREGPLLEAAVRALALVPDVLLVDATGRDHPRGAGLATSLGAVLDLPTVGITHRPLLAEGAWPPPTRGATAPLRIGEQVVGCWLRVRAGARPLAVHPAWRTELDTAVTIVLAATGRVRTPVPLRAARRAARLARAAAGEG
jgi:deoxyribonuclease V